MTKFKLLRKSLLLCGILLLSILTIQAATRPTFDDRPLGFAAVGGTFLVPACGSTPTYRVTNDTELAAAKGNNRIIILAPGQYNTFTISGQTNLSLIGEDGADVKNIPITGSTTKNILIRNIAITRYGTDGLSITGGTNIWIDHCTIGYAVTSSNKEIPDGAMDITNSPDYITISWCKIQNSWKTGLLGSGDSDLGMRHVTYYANYVVNTYQRTPRIRSGNTHVINCYYENTGWFRPTSMTASEYDWQELANYKDDPEYNILHRIITFGYGVMAAYNANAICENNFFHDVRWPILASRGEAEFKTVYGDLQSPDINNRTPIALKQFGNEYDDSGLLPTIKVKNANVSSASCGTEVVPLGYEYAPGEFIINPARLNPGGRSIMFDEYNPSGVFVPSSFTNYYPSGFVAMTAQEVRQIVRNYAGAATVQFCPIGVAPTLTTPINKDQYNADPLVNIVFTWGGGAIDAKVFDLPLGLTATRNTTLKTLTISGTPTTSSTYSVVTEGGTGTAVTVTGTITPKPAIACTSLIKLTISGLASAGVYKLVLFDAAGTTEIKTLADGSFAAGNSDFSFIQGSLSAGAYTYKLLSGASVIKTGSVSIP